MRLYNGLTTDRKTGEIMSNVLDFPKAKRENGLKLAAEKLKQMTPSANSVMTIFSALFYIVRMPLFLVMSWLRVPVVMLCNFISFPLFLCWLFAWYAFPDKPVMYRGFGIISFIAFVAGIAYDWILLKIAPDDF